MALVPEFTIQLGYPSQTTNYFQDTTPDYDASDETGGYGSPNIAKAAVFKTVIYAKPQGSDTYTELTDLDYLPTDGQISFTCDNYVPEEEEEDDEEDEVLSGCDACGGESVLSDCDGVEPTCFADGCWTFKYEVYSDADTVVATTIASQFFYSQAQAAITAIGKKIFNGVSQCNDKKFLDLYYQTVKDFESLKFVAQTDGCDCNCVTNGLSSVQKKIIKLQTDPEW